MLRPLQEHPLQIIVVDAKKHLVFTKFDLHCATSSRMSWMDSWSRPNKQSATPPPLYLTSDDVKYCAACGRVIGARRSHKQNEIVRYCSDGCRKRRLGPLDKKIDRTILALLLGEKDSGIEKIDTKSRWRKGDRRTVISCDEIEDIVFERRRPNNEMNEASADDISDQHSHSSGLENHGSDSNDTDAEDLQGRPPNPTGPGSKEKQQEGKKRAEEREMVRRAARRAVVFGLPTEQASDTSDANSKGAHSRQASSTIRSPHRKCEAVMNGQVVEPSFAKGDWAIRWRE